MKQTAKNVRRVFAGLLSAVLALIPCMPCAGAEEEQATYVVHIDSVNGTRWADTMVVYKERATTEQNKWGWNVVVGADGVAAEKIPGGDDRGANLAIPEGGMVVSGTGDIGQEMYDSIEIGDRVAFDEYGMRVLASKGEIDPFYETEIRITGYNAVRYSDTVIIYNQAGTTTGTNGYGYEVTVNADGYITAAGGNDSEIPAGGYIISAIEPADKATLMTYFIPGAKCEIKSGFVKVTYDESMLVTTVQNELDRLTDELAAAREQLRLVDYTAAEAAIDALDPAEVSTLAERDAMLKEIDRIGVLLIESRTVEVRSVWYVPLETNADAVYETVAEMERVGINQLCLGIISDGKSLVKVSSEHPFRTDSRLRRFDIVQTYVDACAEYGIELVLSVPIFMGIGTSNEDWLTLTNTGEVNEEGFVSPANEDFCAAMAEYLEYIVRHYDIDGIQYDYIRFPYSDGTFDYGFDEETVSLFLEETGYDRSVADGIAAQLASHPKWNDWVNFKISLIDRRVREFSEMMRSYRPDLYISAAIANDTYFSSYCQDATHWIREGTVDGIYPMSYAAGIMESATVKFSAFADEDTFVVMGNGAYQSLTLDEMYLQINQSALFGADGIAFFEWGAYVSHGYADAFAETVFATDALSFTYAESESIAALVETAKKRYELYLSLQYTADMTMPSAFSDYESGRLSLRELYDTLQSDVRNSGYLLQDLELALRIQAMSREDSKGTVTLLPIQTGEDTVSSDTPSSAESVSVSEQPESTVDTAENDGNALLPFLGIAAAVIVIVAAVTVLILKKK